MANTTEVINFIFILLVTFQVKHFICDFPLQREYMLKKFLPGWDFLLPLMVHCAVHASFTLVITLVFVPHLWFLALFDFAIHFLMDRFKSGPKYLGRFNDRDEASFWNCLGFDQMVHHLTHYSIIYMIAIDKFVMPISEYLGL